MRKMRHMFTTSEDLFLVFQSAMDRVADVRGGEVTQSAMVEILLMHFLEHLPGRDWILDALRRKMFSDKRTGRPRGAKDKIPGQRPKWQGGRRPVPKLILKGRIIYQMFGAMVRGERQTLLGLREIAGDQNFSWQELESEAQKDFDALHERDGRSHPGTQRDQDQSEAPG